MTAFHNKVKSQRMARLTKQLTLLTICGALVSAGAYLHQYTDKVSQIVYAQDDTEEAKVFSITQAFSNSDVSTNVLDTISIKKGETAKLDLLPLQLQNEGNLKYEFYRILIHNQQWEKEWLPYDTTQFTYTDNLAKYDTLSFVYGIERFISEPTAGGNQVQVRGTAISKATITINGETKEYPLSPSDFAGDERLATVTSSTLFKDNDDVTITLYDFDNLKMFEKTFKVKAATPNTPPTSTNQSYSTKDFPGYSEEQILAARTWLTLADAKYPFTLTRVEAGTPITGPNGKGKAYPSTTYILTEDFVKTKRSTAESYSIAYKDNGDGTITVYDVPKHWQIDDKEIDQFTQAILDKARVITLANPTKEQMTSSLNSLKPAETTPNQKQSSGQSSQKSSSSQSSESKKERKSPLPSTGEIVSVVATLIGVLILGLALKLFKHLKAVK